MEILSRAYVLLLWLLLCCHNVAYLAAGQSVSRQIAECSLVLFGYGPDQLGVADASMNCTSADYVEIGRNSSFLYTAAQNFQGIQVIEDLECHRRFSYQLTIPVLPLLWFCGDYDILLQHVIIRDVYLDISDSMVQTALLAAGGNARVSISGAQIADNEVGSAIVLLDEAQVHVANQSRITGNIGLAGAGICSRDNSILTISDSMMQRNIADRGGAVLAIDNSTAIIEGSLLRQNNATFGGGAAVADGARLFINNSKLAANAAESGGGISCGAATLVTINNSTLINNSATTEGGATFLEGSSTLIATGHTSFVTNTAEFGGAVFAGADSTLRLLDGSLLLGNSATYGAGVCARDASTVSVDGGSTFVGNKASYAGGALFAQEHGIIEVIASTISNNTANYYGGGLGVNDDAQATLTETTVKGNTASHGAGLSAWSRSSISLQSTTLITGNLASVDGGGIYTSDSAVLVMNDSLVVNNSATDLGGGVYLISGAFDPAAIVGSVKGNSARTEYDIAVLVTTLAVVGNNSVEGFVSRVSTGGIGEGLLQARLNLSGHHGLPSHGMYVRARLDGTLFLGVNETDLNGIVHLNLRIRQPPGQYNIVFDVPAGNCDKIRGIPPVNVSLSIRSCILGEVTPSPDGCELCILGSYSLDPTSTLCQPCPQHASCPGGAVILPDAGFWHSSAKSIQVHRCPNPSACVGSNPELETCSSNGTCHVNSELYKSLQCSSGYQGNLCGSCSEGHGAVKLLTCRACMHRHVIVGLYLCTAIVMLAVIKLMCHWTITGASTVAGGSTSRSRTPPTELLKALVLYMQYMLIVGSMNVEWPATISYPLQALALVWSTASSETLSFACLVHTPLHSIPDAIQRTLFYIGMPVALLVVLLFLELVLMQLVSRRKGTATVSMADRLVSYSFVVAFFFTPSVVHTLFGMFACVAVDRPVSYPFEANAVGTFWVHDMTQICFTGYHRQWSLGLGVPLTVLICLVMPTFISAFTWVNRGKLVDPNFRRHWGFLYRSYKPSCCWWDGVQLCQTMCLVATSVFGVTLGAYYQSLVMNTALAVFTALLASVRPHAFPQSRRAYIQGYGCLFMTTTAALSFLSAGNVQADSTYNVVMGAIVLIVNAAFSLSTVWQLLRLIQWRDICNILIRWKTGLCVLFAKLSDSILAACVSVKTALKDACFAGCVGAGLGTKDTDTALQAPYSATGIAMQGHAANVAGHQLRRTPFTV